MKWGLGSVFQDIAYFRCGIISKNIGVAIAHLTPLLRGP